MSNGAIAGMVLASITGVGVLIAGMSSTYIVDEGRVGVVTNWGRAVGQEGPAGLQFKTPIVTGVREFDVRERALTATLESATFDQLPSTVEISVNWRPDPTRIMEIFVQYGSPDEFAMNTIRPRLEQSLKATIGRFSGSQLTREREAVAAEMLESAKRILAGYPADISSVQIENFTLPDRYMEAVLQKQEQAEATEKEALRLEQQRITAQQEVQTAEAQRDALRAQADGEAYAMRTRAEADAEAIRARTRAEADGIKAIQEAISANPLLIEYERAKRWDGSLPRMVLGDQSEFLMQLPMEE